MEEYLNLGGNSNVKAYSIGQDYIDVVFGRGARYRYSYRSAGIDKVEQMNACKEGRWLKFVYYEVCEDGL